MHLGNLFLRVKTCIHGAVAVCIVCASLYVSGPKFNNDTAFFSEDVAVAQQDDFGGDAPSGDIGHLSLRLPGMSPSSLSSYQAERIVEEQEALCYEQNSPMTPVNSGAALSPDETQATRPDFTAIELA